MPPIRTAPLLLLTTLACGAEASPPPRAPDVPTAVVALTDDPPLNAVPAPEPLPKVDVTLFMMSQCPYYPTTLEALMPELEKLGDRVAFHAEYIGQVTPAGELKSMHGDKEVAGDVAQLCVQKHSSKWLEFVLCQADDLDNVDTNWRSCAGKVGIDPSPIEACIRSDEGTTLLTASFARAKTLGARACPTLFVGDKKHEKPRRPIAFLRSVCEGITESPPKACTSLAPPLDIAVTLLEDARCVTCSTEKVRTGLLAKLENPIFTTLDYGTPEGKALHEAVGGINLPAAFFDAGLDADPEAVRLLGKALQTKRGRRYVSSGVHDPRCFDEGGCKTDRCKQTPTCRKEEPRVIELFMMSKCPYAAKGVTALAEVLENFEKNQERVEVRLRFIGSGDAKTGLKAMHGEAEVEENLRQVCADKHYAAKNKFMSYLKCRASDLKSADWAACTGKLTGVDKAVIERCSTGEEGKRLLEASYELSNETGFGSSPTWLANGKHKFAAVDARTLNEAFCEHNKLKGCDATLSGPPAKPLPTSPPPLVGP